MADQPVLPIMPLKNFSSEMLRSTIVAAFVILSEREETTLEAVVEDCLDACRRGDLLELGDGVEGAENDS